MQACLQGLVQQLPRSSMIRMFGGRELSVNSQPREQGPCFVKAQNPPFIELNFKRLITEHCSAPSIEFHLQQLLFT